MKPIPRPGPSFPIVAAGASAGGLAAFTALLKALPPKTGMAFVLIQHLEPNHPSALASLLSKATEMPVVEVTDGIAVEPNHVYVIPPSKKMTIHEGTLRLSPRSGPPGASRPIDNFAQALAEDKGSAAIGVVLSGTGSDGTQGLKAIKAAGGITFAQEPKTAEWPDMAVSAIAAGSVDFVLSPKHIAAELARNGRHPYLVGALDVAEGSDFDKICLLLRSSTGVDFRLYTQATARRRMARRMALRKIASLEKYAQILKKDPNEVEELADDMFIHVTGFFRDPESFEALRKRVLSKLCNMRPAGDPIRIWVAGCSTGEEVYSIAMLLTEELGQRAGSPKVQIFGTDIQERALEHARAGSYSEAAMGGVSPARLQRFFEKTDRGYQIDKTLRALCIFAKHDLSKDPPFSKLDLVSCRNVLIYMGPILQKRVFSVFHCALKPGGILFLGKSEFIAPTSGGFTTEESKHRIFRRRPGTAHRLESAAQDSQAPAATAARAAATATVDLRKQAEIALLKHYAPPALIVDSDLQILHFQGDASPYLAPATGKPSFHLLKMVRPEFLIGLRTAIDKAGRNRASVGVANLPFEHEGRPAVARLEVRSLQKRLGAKRELLVVFQRVEATKPATAKAGKLERELASAREQLRALISENETSQEEMKAAQEEILSSNEELQSTNQEVETAKEELQSSNEELVTLNDELRLRNEALSELMNDLNSLLVGIDIPVLVLDAGLRVRRFTPLAGSLLNLIPGDVGRPFSDIASNLDVTNWTELLSEAMSAGRSVEREVRDRKGRQDSLRIRPYRANDTRIQGVLVLLMDLGGIHQALAEAREARDVALETEQRADSILNSLTAHVAVLAPDGTIEATNDAWNEFARQNGPVRMKAVGPGANYLRVCESGAAQGDSVALQALTGIQEVLRGRRSFQLEYPFDSATEQRWFLLNTSPLKGTKGGAVITHLDITDRKLVELAAQRSELLNRTLLDSSNQSIVAVNADETIVLVNGITEKMFGYKRSELLGQPLEILVPEGARARHAEHHRGYFANLKARPMGIGLHLEGRRKDGTSFPVEIGLGAM